MSNNQMTEESVEQLLMTSMEFVNEMMDDEESRKEMSEVAKVLENSLGTEEGASEMQVQPLSQGGYMTSDRGVELRFPDGSVFVVTVNRAR